MRTYSRLSILVTIVFFSRYLEISSQRLQIPAEIGEHELWWGWKLLSAARRSFGWAKVERREFIKVKCKFRSNSVLRMRCSQILKNYKAIATAQWNFKIESRSLDACFAGRGLRKKCNVLWLRVQFRIYAVPHMLRFCSINENAGKISKIKIRFVCL